MICKVCFSWLLDHVDLPGWKRCPSCRYSEKMGDSMVTLQELNPKNFKIPEELKDNLNELFEKINKVRKLYNKPMIVTSGYRSLEDHKRIYKEKGITDESKIPMKSKHLYCQAVDISDPNGELQKWCLDNVDKLEEIGLWMEDFSATPNWCHFQIIQPKSGKRFFKP